MNPQFPPFIDVLPALRARGEVVLPGSKSISNRILLLAALSEGSTQIDKLLDSDDTRVMLDSLAKLGVGIEREGNTVLIEGRHSGSVLAGFTASTADLFIGNSGLTIRTLVPAIAASLAGREGAVNISGVPRMHERPIADLVDGLAQLGARIEYLGAQGFPPLRIHGAAMHAGTVRVRGDTSSQFITGLLQAAPLVAREQALVLEVEGELISKPYIEITLNLLKRFGIEVEREGWHRFTVASGQRYLSPGRLDVEGDASSASYFLAAGAIAGGPLRVWGAGRNSIQGDIRFAGALERMGAIIRWGDDWVEAQAPEGGLRGVDLDCNDIPDAAMTLAICALFARGATTLRNIGSWRVKETDRLAAMATELRKLGAAVEEGRDWIRIAPPEHLRHAEIATYDDHRMAMCFALASLGAKGTALRMLDPGCVAKTFPAYFEQLAAVTQQVPVIAIDGPTASGKGTVAAGVAQALGFQLLDSGVLYRLVALVALERGTPLEDEAALGRIAATLDARFVPGRVLLGGIDVSEAVRAEAVGIAASKVAMLAPVRAALLILQHAFAAAPGLVADGRDMGTVVFPQAPLKVFLTASVEARAERRYKQLIDKGFSANIDALSKDLRDRDERDMNRAEAPLRPAEDARILDSSTLAVDAAIRQVLDWWQGAK
jgi:3-phosphoshikimate 1-carboxyvinyltransferase